VLERNVARKTEVPPNIVERDKNVLPLEMYAKLLALAGTTTRERAIFMLACFCALRPSELFGLLRDCYEGGHDEDGSPTGGTLLVVNTAWRGQLQKKKIKKRPVNGETAYRLVPVDPMVQAALEAWLEESEPAEDGLVFPGRRARGRLVTEKPMHADNWLRRYLYPAAEKLGIPFHPSFQVLRRSFGTHADELKMATTEQIAETLGHATGSKVTRLHYIVKTVDPKVREMQRRVTARLLRMDEKASGTVQ
jgi:integrase